MSPITGTGIPSLARPLLPRTTNYHDLNIETKTSGEHALLPRTSAIRGRIIRTHSLRANELI